jgi:hypothetical protein
MTIGPYDFDWWITYGTEHGWISSVVCHTHDGPPMTAEEIEMWDDGEDPCIPIFRVYEPEQETT